MRRQQPIRACRAFLAFRATRLAKVFNVPPQVLSQLTGYVMGSQFAAAHGLSTSVLQL